MLNYRSLKRRNFDEKMSDLHYQDEYGEVMNKVTKRPRDCIDASRILKNLFLGSYEQAAAMEEGLKLMGITHILSIGNQDDMTTKFHDQYKYLNIELNDMKSAKIEKHFDNAVKFIHTALAVNTNNVLVHCWAGISRSATIIMAYLIKHFCLSYTEAFETVRKARHWVSPNDGFRKKLIEWSAKNKRQESKAVISLYHSTRNQLYNLYEGEVMTEEDREKIIADFEYIFGTYHQHVYDVTEELNMFQS